MQFSRYVDECRAFILEFHFVKHPLARLSDDVLSTVSGALEVCQSQTSFALEFYFVKRPLVVAVESLHRIVCLFGGGKRARTAGLLRARQALSQLSYTPRQMVGLSGLEPPTSRLSGVRSNHLSYKPTSKSFRYALNAPALPVSGAQLNIFILDFIILCLKRVSA